MMWNFSYEQVNVQIIKQQENFNKNFIGDIMLSTTNYLKLRQNTKKLTYTIIILLNKKGYQTVLEKY